jgi:antitoxin (DNA-binding transcriptional repressor) of toxin-antitoxin stability system
MTHLSALLSRAAGETIVLARHNKSIAQQVPLDPSPRRQLGFLQGRIDDAFFEPLPDDELERVKLLLDTHVLLWALFWRPIPPRRHLPQEPAHRYHHVTSIGPRCLAIPGAGVGCPSPRRGDAFTAALSLRIERKTAAQL